MLPERLRLARQYLDDAQYLPAAWRARCPGPIMRRTRPCRQRSTTRPAARDGAMGRLSITLYAAIGSPPLIRRRAPACWNRCASGSAGSTNFASMSITMRSLFRGRVLKPGCRLCTAR